MISLFGPPAPMQQDPETGEWQLATVDFTPDIDACERIIEAPPAVDASIQGFLDNAQEYFRDHIRRLRRERGS